MKLDEVLKKQLELVKPTEQDNKKINLISDNFVNKLKLSLKNKRIKAEVFVGGSLAKNTLVKKDIYDIDIFVRFDKKYEDKKISSLLKKAIPEAKKVHGSRDYYQLIKDDIIIEIIPVLKIEKPEQAVNVTDLSYFHVNYILKKVKEHDLADQIRLAKTFSHAQNSYGAESYIHGFSGYALELLICHYKTFLTFIKELAKLNINKEKLILDDAKFYKNKNTVLEELNKSKLTSPIILIDPTFKERNSLSSLSKETFYKFQNACKNFLKNPSSKFFIKKPVFENFKNLKPIIIEVKTNKQPGDIAGTKSKKFLDFFLSRLKKEFELKKSGFEYMEENNLANFYIIINKKKPTIVKGPPITAVNNLNKFKKTHKTAFTKKGFAYVKLKHNLTFNNWFKIFLKDDKKIISDMMIKEIKMQASYI